MNIDWSQLITKAMKDAAAAAALIAQLTIVEDAWRVEELAVIADQLLAIEDADPAAMPGTETQWRSYRTKVRAWKTGAVGFPYAAQRPQRPA